MNEEFNPNVRAGDSVTEALRAMNTGDKLVFPADRAMTVRATASSCGFAWGRVFVTKTDRASRTIEVTRKI